MNEEEKSGNWWHCKFSVEDTIKGEDCDNYLKGDCVIDGEPCDCQEYVPLTALTALRARNEELEKVNQEVWERLDAKDRAELNCKWKAEGRLLAPPSAQQEPKECPTCEGRGKIQTHEGFDWTIKCFTCHGTGYLPQEPAAEGE